MTEDITTDTIRGLMTVRRREDMDLPSAARALVSVHAADGYPVEGVEHPEAWLTPQGMISAWVAEDATGVVGHVAIVELGEDASRPEVPESDGRPIEKLTALARLFVAPEARRRMVGERLVRAVAEYAEAHRMRLVLDVMTKDEAAIRLYERLGWKRFGRSMHAYGDGLETEALWFVAPSSQ